MLGQNGSTEGIMCEDGDVVVHGHGFGVRHELKEASWQGKLEDGYGHVCMCNEA